MNLKEWLATIGVEEAEDDPMAFETQARCFQYLFQYSWDEAKDIVERRRRVQQRGLRTRHRNRLLQQSTESRQQAASPAPGRPETRTTLKRPI